MPATPRRARNFGGSSQHQKLMMANLAASLIAAEAIVTTEAKAKALRPIAEKLITKAKKAQEDGPIRVHRIRQIQGYLGDKEIGGGALGALDGDGIAVVEMAMLVAGEIELMPAAHCCARSRSAGWRHRHRRLSRSDR